MSDRYHFFQHTKAYFHYLLQSKSRWSVHSPFLYSLLEEVIRNKQNDSSLERLQDWQELLKSSPETLPWKELGAGKARANRKVRDIYRTTVRPFRQYRIFNNLVRFTGAQQIVELGTGLGLSTLALAAGNPQSLVNSIEGNESLFQFTRLHSRAYHDGNIDFHQGRIGSILPRLLPILGQVDMAFLDGNHRFHPTLRYYGYLKPYLHEKSILIIDDIHWSKGMEWAWEDLSARPEVGLSVDLFHLGLLFFRSDMEKRHFILRY